MGNKSKQRVHRRSLYLHIFIRTIGITWFIISVNGMMLRSPFTRIHRCYGRGKPWTALYNTKNGDILKQNMKMVEQEMKRIEKEVENIVGYRINLQSHKQLGGVLYENSNLRSTSKEALKNFIASRSGNETKKTIANKVLDWRELKSCLRRFHSTTATDSPTVSTIKDNDEIVVNGSDKREVINKKENVVLLTSGDEYSTTVNSLFDKQSKIDPYWHDALLKVDKPSAKALISQLSSTCPMGYDPMASPYNNLDTPPTNVAKKGTLLSFIRHEKQKLPQCLILTRVGEFYEAYGIDALLLVQHCGLNPMAGKARAGCPIKNIQSTLDGLTSSSFRVAIYEEAKDTGSGRPVTSSRSKLKTRFLSQIVTCAQPTYLYDFMRRGDALTSSSEDLGDWTPSRPYVGIVTSAKNGYTVVEVSMEERTVRVLEGLTKEAVACRLSAFPPADPILHLPLHSSSRNELTFLPSEADGPRVKILPSFMVSSSDQAHAKDVILSSLLQIDAQANSYLHHDLSPNDFQLIASSSSTSSTTQPLHVETARQLGLMDDPTIPSLLTSTLGPNAPAATKRFVRKWLLLPPPSTVSASMSKLLQYLSTSSHPIPPLPIQPISKVLPLLRASQARAVLFRDIATTLSSFLSILDTFDEDEVLRPLLNLVQYETGMAARSTKDIASRCRNALEVIQAIIATSDDPVTDSEGVINQSFFERNEVSWRCNVNPSASNNGNVTFAYENVDDAVDHLKRVIIQDFWNNDPNLSPPPSIAYDIFDNLISLKQLPSFSSDTGKFIHPKDRNHKTMKNRYTTESVQKALSKYLLACEAAQEKIVTVLSELSATLCTEGHLPAIIQASHANLILSTAMHHLSTARSSGWNLPSVSDHHSPSSDFQNLFPYWMSKSQSVSNTFTLDNIFCLTAPNMSGKSTLMRSTAAAVLLSLAGFMAPVGKGTRVRRFDAVFVRGASSDVPLEGKSAFGAEMADVAVLLRCCGENSLVFVDELGRGTSPKDGMSLAAAVLEQMAHTGMTGIFSTHLHGIMNLLPSNSRIQYKRMQITPDYKWTFRLQDGICTDSLALVTAKEFGLPSEILQRAQHFAQSLDDIGLSSQGNEESSRDCEDPSSSIDERDDSTVIQPASPNLDHAIEIVQDIVGTTDSTILIPPLYTPPTSFDGCSCVYILEISNATPSDPRRYYVGETDTLSQRLSQHRYAATKPNNRYMSSSSGTKSEITAVAVRIPDGGKSVARNVESLVIRRMAQSGFDMVSVADGRRRPVEFY